VGDPDVTVSAALSPKPTSPNEAHPSPGSYTPGAEAAPLVGCLGGVRTPPRDAALAALQLALRTPPPPSSSSASAGGGDAPPLDVAVLLSGDVLRRVGAAHVAPSPRPGLAQDCTHWCAPGPTDALAHLVVALVSEHGGDAKRFEAAMRYATQSEEGRSGGRAGKR
jgi:hypothetical protein